MKKKELNKKFWIHINLNFSFISLHNYFNIYIWLEIIEGEIFENVAA
jgi:hypothetical protein